MNVSVNVCTSPLPFVLFSFPSYLRLISRDDCQGHTPTLPLTRTHSYTLLETHSHPQKHTPVIKNTLSSHPLSVAHTHPQKPTYPQHTAIHPPTHPPTETHSHSSTHRTDHLATGSHTLPPTHKNTTHRRLHESINVKLP